ncbi:hypothetical protein GH714_002898 [Hevea brasiliensis]|uniref:3'-5' exonuclease domain-containing protein n=1 Tax=Hevea brasiliensis TaxID=3981 RepID=A0A6A6N8U9_HEVBR|nr:hypothetical protein GH714_002898 [Hevea brasiliensis]
MTNYRMMGLKALVLDGLQKVIPKPREITMSEWNAKELTIEQIEYACLDAFVSLELGIFLSKHRREITQYLENTSPKKIVNLTLESDQTTNDSEQLDDELKLRQSFGEYEEEVRRMKSARQLTSQTSRKRRPKTKKKNEQKGKLQAGAESSTILGEFDLGQPFSPISLLYSSIEFGGLCDDLTCFIRMGLRPKSGGYVGFVYGNFGKEAILVMEESSARSCEVNFGRGNKSIQTNIDIRHFTFLELLIVKEQLRKIAKGEYTTPIIERRKLGTIVFAAINLPVPEICSSLDNLAQKNPKVEAFLQDKHLEHNLKKTHLTLAHKRSHGVTAVASYGLFLNQKVPVELTALLFTDKMAALEAQPGSVDGEKIVSKNEWPHATIWTAEGVAPKEANTLPRLFSEGKATRVEFSPPITISGTVQFY